jgi:hypothetical protein
VLALGMGHHTLTIYLDGKCLLHCCRTQAHERVKTFLIID